MISEGPALYAGRHAISMFPDRGLWARLYSGVPDSAALGAAACRFNDAMILDRRCLDALYERWNRPEYISPDPLETLSGFGNTGDREVAALTAACMAYGRVSALLPPLRRVLGVMGERPRLYVTGRSEGDMARDMKGVVHRFARPEHFAALLAGAGAAIRRCGGLEAVFLEGFGRSGDAVGGLEALGAALRSGAKGEAGHLLADASRGSACKRLFLFLRWMVRRDAVDPGGWNAVSPRHLLPPLDTWTHRIALRAGWTQRRTADMKTVREVSAALRRINPEDPVKYDFALSRYGIRSELNLEALFAPAHDTKRRRRKTSPSDIPRNET